MLPRTLRRVHKFPYFLHVHCSRHLDSHMLSMLHGILRHHHMAFPVCCDIHEVYVVTLAQLLPHLLVPAVSSSLVPAVPDENLLAFLHIGGLDIAQCHYFSAVYVAHASDRAWAAHPETYEAYTYGIDCRCGESEHVLLTCRTFRDFRPDDGIRGAATGTQGQH